MFNYDLLPSEKAQLGFGKCFTPRSGRILAEPDKCSHCRFMRDFSIQRIELFAFKKVWRGRAHGVSRESLTARSLFGRRRGARYLPRPCTIKPPMVLLRTS